MTDAIILKRCPTKPYEAIAFMPDANANPGRIVSYMHIGQHSEADYWFYCKCRPLSPRSPEGREILRELRAIGYKPRVRRRMPSWRKRGKP